MAELRKVAGILLERSGKLLVLLRTDGRWGLPGGGVEDGEDEQTAAIRELFEETGYRAKKDEIRLDFVYDQPLKSTKTNSDIIYTVFRLELKKPLSVKLDPNEHTDYRWVTPEEAVKIHDSIAGLSEVFQKAYPSLLK